eukprot:g18876.t1
MAPKVMKKVLAAGAKAKAKAKAKVRAQAKRGAVKSMKAVLPAKAEVDSDSDLDEDEAFSAALLAEQRGLGKMPVAAGKSKALNTGGKGGCDEGEVDQSREYLLALESRPSPLDALASSVVPAGCIARKLLQHNGITDLFLLPGLELKTLKGITALNAGERAMVKLVTQAAPKFLKGVDTKLFGQYFGDTFNKEAVATLRSTLEGGQPVEDLATFYAAAGSASQQVLTGRSIQVVQNFTKALRFSGVLSEAEYHDMIALGASRKLEPGTYRDMLNTETRADFAGLGGRLVLRCTVLPVPAPVKPVKGDPSVRPGGTQGGKGGGGQRALPKVWDTVSGGWVTASAEVLGGVCFDHISTKGCTRGRSCRFSHTLPSRFLLQEPGQKDTDSGKDVSK